MYGPNHELEMRCAVYDQKQMEHPKTAVKQCSDRYVHIAVTGNK